MSQAETIDGLFQQAVSAMDAGDVGALERLLTAHPRLVRERLDEPGPWLRDQVGDALEGFFRRPYLLWFVAEDPVRNGRLPKNIAGVARTIVRAIEREGVSADEAPIDYALRLVCWSWIARQCGVQIELVDVMLDAGASPDGRNLYVVGRAEPTLAVFSRDPTTGALDFLEVHRSGENGVTQIGSSMLSIPSDGRHLYTSGIIFARDSMTGALTFVAQAPIGAWFAITPDGQFLYTSGMVDVTAYRRDVETEAGQHVADHVRGAAGQRRPHRHVDQRPDEPTDREPADDHRAAFHRHDTINVRDARTEHSKRALGMIARTQRLLNPGDAFGVQPGQQPGLHVGHPRPVGAVPVETERPLGDGAGVEDGVHVTDEQQARPRATQAADEQVPELRMASLGPVRHALELILKLWTEPRVTYRGKYFRVENAILEPKPLQKPHPPLLIGGVLIVTIMLQRKANA